MAVREILKHPEVKKVTLVDLDPAMTRLGQTNEIFTRYNLNSLNNAATTIVNQDAYQFLKDSRDLFDVIIIDLPDPNSVELSKLYSREFYRTIYTHLSKYGVMVTQATDASHANITFCCILKTMRAAGFSCLPYRNYVPTMGNWGWILGMKKDIISKPTLDTMVSALDFSQIETKFLNRDVMASMRLFGKDDLNMVSYVDVNTELNPVLHQYMQQAYPLMK
jgi:spermidine synthase